MSSAGSDFNYDFHVSFTQEQSWPTAAYDYNFEIQDGERRRGPARASASSTRTATGDIFHTYSSYARGGDILIGAHNYLDLTPKGRNESGIMDWVRHHDRYEDKPAAESCCQDVRKSA